MSLTARPEDRRSPKAGAPIVPITLQAYARADSIGTILDLSQVGGQSKQKDTQLKADIIKLVSLT